VGQCQLLSGHQFSPKLINIQDIYQFSFVKCSNGLDMICFNVAIDGIEVNEEPAVQESDEEFETELASNIQNQSSIDFIPSSCEVNLLEAEKNVSVQEVVQKPLGKVKKPLLKRKRTRILSSDESDVDTTRIPDKELVAGSPTIVLSNQSRVVNSSSDDEHNMTRASTGKLTKKRRAG